LAVIEIDGVITDSMTLMDEIRELKKNKQLKGLVVRVNSPGGAVGASQEIYMELKKLKEKMPVAVSMGDLAASGGLYVSLGADVIYALPGTLTGSMGVLLELTNFSKLLQKIYVDAVTIRSGELKDAGNPTHPLGPKAKEYFQALILETFGLFKEAVSTERKLKPEALKYLSDGRVVNGVKAVELGLVDKLGTFQDAVQFVKEKAKIDGEPQLAFLSRKPKSLVQKIVEGSLAPITRWANINFNPVQFRWEPGVR
jgi:protease-4